MLFFSALFALLLVLVSGTRLDRAAIFRHLPGIPKLDAPAGSAVFSPTGDPLPPYNTWYYFDQLIDHDNPERGTFKQRYYFTAECYKPGGPIILTTPGEQNAEPFSGYLTNVSITGQIAQVHHGATVVLEHRFFGFSNPCPDLTVESLRLLTPEQAIADLVFFAQHAHLPMPNGHSVKAPHQAPWILVGGSYAGALTSWTLHSHPGIFWAGYSSSGVVQAIQNFWAYFEPIRQNMPRNCAANVIKVISHMDKVFASGDACQIAAFKAQFGMQNITHVDDVASAMRLPLWTWVDMMLGSDPDSEFNQFCDALEVKDCVDAPEEGRGLEGALQAWGKYMTRNLAIMCQGEVDDECFGTYDPGLSFYTDSHVDNPVRAWQWMTCNFFGFWNDGAPKSHPSLVSRLITPAYNNRQCSYFFPSAFPDPTCANPEAAAINKKYGGWNATVPRLFSANGKRDPWRDATVSSDLSPRNSTPQMPIFLGNGLHASDLITANGALDASVLEVQRAALRYMSKWLSEWCK